MAPATPHPAKINNWFMAAAPSHPALAHALSFVEQHAGTHFHANTLRDTLERTGPALWTDSVLRAAAWHLKSPAGEVRNEGNRRECNGRIPWLFTCPATQQKRGRVHLPAAPAPARRR